MKRYEFRLDHVRRARRVQEQLAAAALAAANHDVDVARDELTARLARYAADGDAAAMDAASPAGVFVADRERREKVALALLAAERSLMTALGMADARRASWTEAATRVAALDRLDERQREEHAAEVQREDDKTVDDIVVDRYRRTRDDRG